jgi:mannosyltransferase
MPLRLLQILGAILILVGLFTPAPFLIETVRKFPQDPILAKKLLDGVLLFKLGLVAIGLVAIALAVPHIRQKIGWHTATPQQRRDHDKYDALLWILLVVSFVLRLYKLGEGLWLDEIGMYLKYLTRPFGELLTTYDSENQHFLYTILARLSIQLFGDNGWALRFPALLFGCGSIWALFIFGCEITTRREAFLSSALLSLSYYHVWFSQNARGYTGLLFWTLYSSFIFLRALSTGASKRWILYAVTVALGVFTQFVMIFVATTHFIIYLYLLWNRKTDRSGLFMGFVLSGLLMFQLYALVLPQFFGKIGMQGTVAVWNSPLWTMSELARGMSVNFAGGIAAVAALIVFGAGFWSYVRTKPILIWLLMLPPVLGSIIVLAMKHPLWPRFFFFAFGFAALVVIRGGTVIGRKIGQFVVPPLKAESFAVSLCCGFILISVVSIPPAYRPKQDFVGALTYVQQNRNAGDAVVTVGTISTPYAKFFKTDFIPVKSQQNLQEIASGAKRTWVLYMIPEDVRALYPEIMASIEKNFKLVKVFPSPLADGAIFIRINR